MIKEVLFLQTSALYGQTSFEQLLNFLEQAGFFNYVLPFLLIFSLIFGILTKVNLFKDNRSINVIIALAVGLMSLQFEFVSSFFAQVFPRLGVGLVIILVVLIFVGLFRDPDKHGINLVLFIIAAIITVVVIAQSASSLGWIVGIEWLEQNLSGLLGTVLTLVVVIVAIVVIINASKPKNERTQFSWRPVLDKK